VALEEAGVDVSAVLHRPYTSDEPLPWELISVRQGRDYLLRELEAVNLAE
jgi:hypothetical protein